MRNVVLVGSSGSIGSAIHNELKSEHVISFSKQTPSKFNNTHHYIDLSRPISVDEIKEKIDVDVVDDLIYTPGIAHFNMLEDTPLNIIDEQYNIQVRNLIVFIQAILPKIKKSPHGRIVIISSVYGQVGASCESVYASMKGAQNTLVKSLAVEYAGTNVTVNAVAPGVVKGKMTDLLSDVDLKTLIEDLPQRRLIEPSEVAKLVMYILSEDSQSITGQIFNINGGWYT